MNATEPKMIDNGPKSPEEAAWNEYSMVAGEPACCFAHITADRQDQFRRMVKAVLDWHAQNAGLEVPSVDPWWLNYSWNPEETDATDCVRCGASMRLGEGGEWDDRPEFNFCHNCGHALVDDCMKKLSALAQRAELAEKERDEWKLRAEQAEQQRNELAATQGSALKEAWKERDRLKAQVADLLGDSSNLIQCEIVLFHARDEISSLRQQLAKSKQGWVARETRMPTREDADTSGCVLWADSVWQQAYRGGYGERPIVGRTPYSHWMPIPSLPSSESAPAEPKFKVGNRVRVKPIGVEATGVTLEVVNIQKMNVQVINPKTEWEDLRTGASSTGQWFSEEELELAPQFNVGDRVRLKWGCYKGTSVEFGIVEGITIEKAGPNHWISGSAFGTDDIELAPVDECREAFVRHKRFRGVPEEDLKLDADGNFRFIIREHFAFWKAAWTAARKDAK